MDMYMDMYMQMTECFNVKKIVFSVQGARRRALSKHNTHYSMV